jgi:hypothetical protein
MLLVVCSLIISLALILFFISTMPTWAAWTTARQSMLFLNINTIILNTEFLFEFHWGRQLNTLFLALALSTLWCTEVTAH